jgi:hypothetical protein
MSTTALPSATTATPVRSEVRFPVYDLGACVAVAKAIHEKGGGSATDDHLAAFLGYKSANNGAFVNRVAASKLFGLIEGGPTHRTITQLAQKILMPIRDTDPRQGLVEAFMRVPLYSKVYDEYKGKELPPQFGLKNALRTQFGVTPKRIDRALAALIDSAETAGFFDVRGSRTQLIMPAIAPRPAPTPTSDDSEEGAEDQVNGGNGGSGGGRFNPPPVKTKEELQNEYVGTLIALLRDKGAEGDAGADLMARIEKLLGLST